MIDIKNSSGVVLASVLEESGSKRKFELMKDDYITLKFTLLNPVTFKLGSYVECKFGRFEVVEDQTPTWNTSTGGYDYELKLEAYYMKWKNKIFKYRPELSGGNESSWSITHPLASHLEIFKRNLQSWGYKYNGSDFYTVIDSGVPGDMLYITYSNTNLIDALTMMAEAAGCEWWVEGAEIHFGYKEEQVNAISVKQGINAQSVSISRSSGEYFTRILAFGGTNNISSRYRKKLEFRVESVTSMEITKTNNPLNPAYFMKSLLSYETKSEVVSYSGSLSLLEQDEPGLMMGEVRLNLTYPSRKDVTYIADLSDFEEGENIQLDFTNYVSEEFNVSIIIEAYDSSNMSDKTELYKNTVICNPTKEEPICNINIGGTFESLVPSSYQDGKAAFLINIETRKRSSSEQLYSIPITVYGRIDYTSKYGKVDTDIYIDGTKYDVTINPLFYSYSDERAYRIGCNNLGAIKVGDVFTVDGLVRESVPIGYFDSDTDGQDVIGVVQNRLMLPEGTPYVDVYDNMTDDEVIEGVVTFDYVFPSKSITVSKVEESMEEQVEEDDEGNETPTGVMLPVYTIYASDLKGFSSDYIIGDELTVTFQNGGLGGLSFGATFLPDKSTSSEAAFEVVPNENYGGRLPDIAMKPSSGDTFIMAGYDTEYLFTGLTEEAEDRLLSETLAYKDKIKGNIGTATVTMYSDWSADNSTSKIHPFDVGQKITLQDIALPEGTVMRVIGYELNFDIPTDKPVYTIGNSSSYSRLGALEDKINSSSSDVSRYMGGSLSTGGIANIIKVADATKPTDSNVYSAKRTDVEIDKGVEEAKEYTDEVLGSVDDRYISKVKPDKTNYKVQFMDGIEVGDAVDSMIAGKGTIVSPNGRIQTDRLEVRGSMTVMDLIINELHALAGDYSLTDSGTIETVEELEDGTYRLTLRKDTEYDFTSLDVNDVLYSIVNNLKMGGTDYYTSWMRVISKNINDNAITVVLYPDSEVPGGKNYPPAEGYNLTRRGNTTLPSEGETNERAQGWLISSREGRIMFLANVYKPILEDYNYAAVFGKLPNIDALKHIAIPENATGVMAQYGIFQNLHQYDYNGDVVPRQVDRGDWSLTVAQSNKPYRNVTTSVQESTGTTYTLIEQHTVRHVGCIWGCLIDKTELEPKWNSAGWQLLEGNNKYSLTFVSSNGWSFFMGQVNTEITAVINFGNIDITEDAMALTGTEVTWTRDSGNAPNDNTWTPTYVDGQKNVIKLTAYDMPPGFGNTVRSVRFYCVIYIPDGEVTQKVDNYVGINI